MQIFKQQTQQSKIGLLDFVPSRVEYQTNAPAKIIGKTVAISATCIHCHNPRCMYFDKEEIQCGEMEDFSSELTNSVCPVEAITIDAKNGTPLINTSACLNCGICASRCPVGAIYFDKSKIKVSTQPNVHIKCTEATPVAIKQQQEFISCAVALPHQNPLQVESDEALERVYNQLEHLKSGGHNIFVRNLLIALSANCAIRRTGDVYTRMDAVYSTVSGEFGAVEVEFGRDTLDASRGILDDIAVMNTRYNINKHRNKPLVVCLHFPNARQGYWQVVKDIRVVENIWINTVSIGELLILLWNNKIFDTKYNRHYLDYDHMSAREQLSKQLGRTARISTRFLGILEPFK